MRATYSPARDRKRDIEFLCSYKGVSGRAKLCDGGKTYLFRGSDNDTFSLIPRADFSSTVTML